MPAFDSNTLRNFQLTDPVVTELTTGEPGQTVWPGDLILDTVNVPKTFFQYPHWPVNPTLIHKETVRAPFGQIQSSDFKMTLLPGTLERRTHEGRLDDWHVSNADQLVQLERREWLLAKGAVDLDQEVVKSVFLLEPANYGAEIPAGGAEFNVDSKTTMLLAINALLDANPLRTHASIKCFLSNTSWEAALEDPIFLAKHAVNTSAAPSISDWVRYLHSGLNPDNFFTQPASYLVDENSTTRVDMYGDTAILFIDNSTSGVKPSTNFDWGRDRFAAWTTINGGQALQMYREDNRTTRKYPWQNFGSPLSLMPSSGVLVTATVFTP